ncbi:MAG: C25 family cysteine peptidase, partial [Proteobacteria bacterium]|nr:C25 family cysteine peptidase [Pseudomonadota bacterium]
FLRVVAALSVSIGASTALAKVTVKKSAHTPDVTTYDFNVEDVIFKTKEIGGKKFSEARLTGIEGYEGVEYELGAPELPVVRLLVVGDVSVKGLSDFQNQSEQIPFALKPSQPSWSKSLKVQPPVTYNVAAYKSNSLLGVEPFSVVDAGSVRGNGQKLVTLRPFAYNPVEGSYSLRRHFTVSVRAPAVKSEDVDVAPTIAFVLGAKFASSPKVQELEQSKLQQGFRVKRIVIGQDGVSTDVELRAALQALLKDQANNLRYAILIGDSGDVPSHVATSISGVTDHFYRAIDTNDYDSDISGPDIGVGRLSVNTEAQLVTVVDKILRYQQGTFGRTDWFNHPAFVTTHDRWQVAEATHNEVITRFFGPKGYDRDFPDALEKGGDKLYPISLHATPAQIVRHMSAGRTIINYSGHGSNVGWEDVTTANVNEMMDTDSLPYVLSNACITGDFRKEPVFAETWQRAPHGAIAFFGSMDSSYWDEDDILEKTLYTGMFTQGIRAFDLLHQNALSGVWKFYAGAGKSKYYWETYVTFGDPSLEFRPTRPESVTVDGFDSVIMGSAESPVRVINAAGEGVPNIHVTLFRAADGISVTGVTDATGTAKLRTGSFAGDVSELSLTVYGDSIETISRQVPVIVPNRTFFGFSNWRVNGRQAAGVHPGETVQLSGVVENYGLIASRGGTVRLEGVVGPAIAGRTQANVPSLASRERHSIGEGLTFVVTSGAMNGESIRANLRWTTQEGESGVLAVVIPVLRADLSLVALDYGSHDSEGVDGSGDVYITIKNTGNDTMKNGTLSGAPGACTAAVAGNPFIKNLAPGQSLRLESPFHVSTNASNSCANGSTGSFTFQGSYEGLAMTVPLRTSEVSYLVGALKIVHEHVEGMGLGIPDNAPGVEKIISVPEAGRLRDISVAIKVQHPYVGDLTITLVTPSGQSIALRTREGGAGHDLEVRWGRDGENLEALRALAGQEVQGDWKLIIKDTASSDVGTWSDFDFVLRHW